MAFTGKKAFLAAGVLVSTMAFSGVAAAEQSSRRAMDPGEEPESNALAQYESTQTQDKGEDGGQTIPARADSGNSQPEEDASKEDTSRQSSEQSITSEQNVSVSVGSSSKERRRQENRENSTQTGGHGEADGDSAYNPPDTFPKPQPSRSAEPTASQRQDRRGERDETARRGNATGEKASAGHEIESQRIQRRVRQLERQERAGEIPRAATGYSPDRRARELRIAREQIVADPVDELSLRRYKQLYEEAAEEYGFGEDWYILAAVGKVESNHGQNMGPSSAGALGPMQFMPSTWDAYGLDANGDGRANIMDPEDAIPSAARYLKIGGAPEDWYKALFTYNHAGWYVEKVLKVAEGYRQAAGDDEVGPYYLEDR